MSPVLITGGSGFIGSAVVRAFIAEGFRVRALIRPSSPRTNLAGLNVQIVEGDIRDAASVSRAMAGMRFVVHCAADYRLWVRDSAELLRSNIDGTENVVRAALEVGAERLIFTSSVATLALRPDGGAADESELLDESAAIGMYKRSKVAAERIVREAVRSAGLPAVIVNPSAPVGPRDIKPTPTGRVVLQAAAGRMPGYVDTGLNLVHVDDVAQGHLAALRRGAIGERYILGGQNVLLAEMLCDIARLTNHPSNFLRLPRRLLYPLAACAELAARVTGKEPLITLDGLRMAKHRMFFSAAKAERELGFRARPYVEGLRDAIDWFRAAGYLR